MIAEEIQEAVETSPVNAVVYDELAMERMFSRSIDRAGHNRKSWSRSELAAIALRVQRAGSEKEKLEAQHELACTALCYMMKIARGYRGRASHHFSLLDLFGIGYLGLFRASEDYDPKTCVFTTYATAWVHQHIRRALSDLGRTVRIPSKKGDKIFNFIRGREELMHKLGRMPTLGEIARHLDLDIQTADEYQGIFSGELSLDVPTNAGDESSGSADTFLSTLHDESALAPDLLLDEKISRSTLWARFGLLDERERRVLELRFGLGDEEPQSCREVGGVIGVSGEMVRKVEKVAIGKLRKSLGGDKSAYF